ncbi:MAG: hypothetical protein Kilf2KO_11440 [Rhodospirillales bacterium]
MYKHLIAAAALVGASFVAVPTVQADDCDPAVMHFFKADGLATTKVGAHKMADMCFDAADTNDDGMVDREEWINHNDSLFDLIDSDGDGSASVEEVNRLQQDD